MAQTGFTPISNYYSATATNVPTAGNLVAGELAINTNDGKLFYKDSSGVVQTIATKATAALPTTTTGSGSLVLATSPTIKTPALGGATSGSVTLAVPAVAGSNTATFPAATGTVMVSGNMPAFSAYLSSNQSATPSTWTKVQCNTEEFDTNTNYDNATNYRFTPTVSGYYQVSGATAYGASITNPNGGGIAIYKNGNSFKQSIINGVAYTQGTAISALVFFNGSTDYVELYGYPIGGAGTVFNANANNTYFQAIMVRAA
jgi:hypothetical protein